MKAGDVAAEFVDRQLTYIRERRNSVEARGIAVITTSGILVTLEMAFIASFVPSKVITAPAALICAGLALLGFLIAVALGILTNAPRNWQEVSPSSLRPLISESHWDAAPERARREIASRQIDILEQSTKQTNRKGKLLAAAFWAELAGMVMLAAAAVVVAIIR